MTETFATNDMDSRKNFIADFVTKSEGAVKHPKQHLSLVRQLCMCTGFQLIDDESIISRLLSLLVDLPDTDVERKIIRTIYCLIMDIMIGDQSRYLVDKYSSQIKTLLLKEISTPIGSRYCLGWRLSSCLSDILNITENVSKDLQLKIQTLKYPEKQKRVLIGQKKIDRDYRNQLEEWSIYFSAYRRISNIIPVDCLESVLVACTSSHTSLARHGLALVASAASKDPRSIGTVFITKLHENVLPTSDIICCQHILHTCHSLVNSASTSDSDLAEIRTVMKRFLNDSRIKVSLEAAGWLSELWAFRDAVVNVTDVTLIDSIQTVLLKHLTTASVILEDGMLSNPFNLFPICRTCCVLGRVLAMRPRQSKSDAYVASISPDDEAVATIVQPLGKQLANLITALSSDQLLYLTHLRGEVLKAMMWMIPDARESDDTYSSTWRWLQSQIVLAACDLGPELMTAIVSQGIIRLRDSPFYSAPVVSMLLAVTEETVWCTLTDTAVALLLRVWTSIVPVDATPSSVPEHAKRAICRSVMSMMDGPTVEMVFTRHHKHHDNHNHNNKHHDNHNHNHNKHYNNHNNNYNHNHHTNKGNESHSIDYSQSKPYSTEITSLTSHLRPHHDVIRGMRLHGYWFLAEYAQLWVNTTPSSIGQFQSVLFDANPSALLEERETKIENEPCDSSGVPLITAVIMRLIQGLWTEGYQNRIICTESLTKIAIRLGSSHPAILHLILEELKAVEEQEYQGGGDINALLLAVGSYEKQAIDDMDKGLLLQGNELDELVRQIDYRR